MSKRVDLDASTDITDTQSTDPVTEVILEQQVATEESQISLMEQLQTALDSKNFKEVATISRKIDQLTKSAEAAELSARKAKLDAMSNSVKQTLANAVQPLIDSGELDDADGIWFSYDFGEQTPTVRLMRTAPKATKSSGSSGTGKKFDISTDDMLAKHGSEEYKDGLTFQEAYDLNTDKNWRFAIRTKLLKLEGII